MSKDSSAKGACPSCGGAMTFGKRRDVIRYKGLETTVEVEALWCNDCDDAVLAGDALKKRERAYLELKAKADGLLPPTQIVKVRKQLRLSQRRAGEVLGGGPRAFQKYEGGTIPPSAAMSNLLRLLSNDPERLSELISAQTSSSKKGTKAAPIAGATRTTAKVGTTAKKRGAAKTVGKRTAATGKRASSSEVPAGVGVKRAQQKPGAPKREAKPRRTRSSTASARTSSR